MKILAFYFQKKEDEKKEARKRGMRKGIRNLYSVMLAHISVSVVFFLYNFPLLNSCLFFGSAELRLRKLYVLDRRAIGGGVSSYISSERVRLGL